jgi:hypothetical protein
MFLLMKSNFFISNIKFEKKQYTIYSLYFLCLHILNHVEKRRTDENIYASIDVYVIFLFFTTMDQQNNNNNSTTDFQQNSILEMMKQHISNGLPFQYETNCKK